MDLPQPPKDTDLRNIIDKLAQFVARNGPEFEQMTKSKQKNNPKFGFLYGGEHFNYYQYKVTTEQAILKQGGRRDSFPPLAGQYNIPQPNNPPGMPSIPVMDSNGGHSGPSGNLPQWVSRQMVPERPQGITSVTATAIDTILTQQAALREQIKQSEANLNAQHTVLIQQQQSQLEDTVANAQAEMIQRLSSESNISMTEFDGILQPIIDSCTKDSISNGKGWILSHALNHESCKFISQYLLKKVTTGGAVFMQKLHIIYLVNDVLHHCARKNADELKKSLETVVVPMFCNASIGIAEDQENKLNKLLKLWESKSNYFIPSIIEKMKDPTNSYQEYTTGLISQYANLITPLTQQTKLTFENYQKQHQAFVAHSLQQIQQLDIQKQIIEQQLNAPQMAPDQSNIMPPNNMPQNVPFGPPPFNEQMFNQQGSMLQNNQIPPPYEQQGFCNNNQPLFSQNDQNYGSSNGIQSNNGGDVPYEYDSIYSQNSNSNPANNSDDSSNVPPPSINLSQPPPGFFEGNVLPPPSFHNGMPDLSKPPPGFSSNVPEVCPDDLLPSVPYFELPAGLMVPLIMLEDTEYKPLDPDAIKLPPPAPPSERLLAAVKAFYAAPNHTRPQDSKPAHAIKQFLGSSDLFLCRLKISNGTNPVFPQIHPPAFSNDQFFKTVTIPPNNSNRRNEGWEKLGLYEYYRAKNAARKQKEEDIKNGLREKSRSPSPILLEHFPIRSIPIRRYRSKSRSLSREREKSRSKSPPSKTRSPSPDREHGTRRTNRRSRRPSPSSSSPSQSPGRTYNKIRNSPEPDDRSSESYHSRASNRSPPHVEGNINISELDANNKGHQMLRKMGWTQGAGLGATGQGITAPVSARDKDGRDINMSDPYENFRKNKGAAFITRMKERALERSTT